MQLLGYAFTFFITSIVFGAPSRSAQDGIVERLKVAYANCELKESSEEIYKCRSAAYKAEAQNFCRGNIENCFGGKQMGDMRLMDPYRCFNPKHCEFLENGDVKMTYKNSGGVCTKETQRTELTDSYKVMKNESIEYNMEMALPSNTDLQVPSLLVAQFKASSGNSPPLALRYKQDGRLTVSLRQGYDKNIGTADSNPISPNGNYVEQSVMRNVPPNKPLKIKIQIQPGPMGFVRLQIDGNTVWGWDGPVGYPPDPQDKQSGNYFKIGPYDHSCKQKDPISIVYGKFQHGRVIDKLPLPQTRSAGDSAPAGVDQ